MACPPRPSGGGLSLGRDTLPFIRRRIALPIDLFRYPVNRLEDCIRPGVVQHMTLAVDDM